MKLKLTVILSIFFLVVAFSQNPIIKEEHYKLSNDEWKKISIIERDYNENHELIYESHAYYNAPLEDWLTDRERYYDNRGNLIKAIDRNYHNGSIFVAEFIMVYNQKNQLIYESSKGNDRTNRELFLQEESIMTYLDECTFITKRNKRKTAEDPLLFDAQILHIYDEECRPIRTIYSLPEEVVYDEYIDNFKAVYEDLSNGQRRRTVTFYPSLEPELSYVIKKEVYDKEGRAIHTERSFCPDCLLFVNDIQYSKDQKKETESIYEREENSSIKLLIRREVVEKTDGSILKNIEARPFIVSTQNFFYNSFGHLIELEDVRLEKLEGGGIAEKIDRNTYSYKYNCDNQPIERIESIEGTVSKNRIDYTYLQPSSCELADIDELAANVFPNPVHHFLTIESAYFLNQQPIIEIIDQLGRVISQHKGQAKYRQIINTSHLLQGTYYMTFNTNEKRVSKPFVVLHQ